MQQNKIFTRCKFLKGVSFFPFPFVRVVCGTALLCYNCISHEDSSSRGPTSREADISRPLKGTAVDGLVLPRSFQLSVFTVCLNILLN